MENPKGRSADSAAALRIQEPAGTSSGVGRGDRQRIFRRRRHWLVTERVAARIASQDGGLFRWSAIRVNSRCRSDRPRADAASDLAGHGLKLGHQLLTDFAAFAPYRFFENQAQRLEMDLDQPERGVFGGQLDMTGASAGPHHQPA